MAFTGGVPDNSYDIPEVKLLNFLPPGFPRVYDDGSIPLRVQVAQDRQVLHTVLTKPKKGIYMCSHCKVRFSSFGPLLDHIDANDIKRPHRCTYEDCPWKVVGFTKLRQLNRHIKSVHLDRNEYECTVPGCGKFFGRIDLLNRHVKSIHENKRSRFNMKLEARRRSSATSTGSTATNITQAGDSPTGSLYSNSRFSSPEILNPTLHTTGSHPSPLHSELPIITTPIPPPPSQPVQESSGTPEPAASSKKYKHTIRFLTNDQ